MESPVAQRGTRCFGLWRALSGRVQKSGHGISGLRLGLRKNFLKSHGKSYCMEILPRWDRPGNFGK